MSFTTLTFSQKAEKKILLTIDDEPVYFDEFTRVYEKNLDMVQDENQKSKEAYLDLFVNYKLKIKEAHTQELHKNPTFIKEFSSYRNQLAQNYLYDQEITEDLIVEGYERLQEELNANHILLRVAPDAHPKDTLEAYNKLKAILDRARNGEDFVELAKITLKSQMLQSAAVLWDILKALVWSILLKLLLTILLLEKFLRLLEHNMAII